MTSAASFILRPAQNNDLPKLVLHIQCTYEYAETVTSILRTLEITGERKGVQLPVTGYGTVDFVFGDGRVVKTAFVNTR